MMSARNRTQLPAGLEMTIAMLISGTIGWFVIQSGRTPFEAVFFRCLFGSIGLGIYAYFRGLLRREYFTRFNLAWMALGGAALVFNWVLLFSSYQAASISIATILYQLQPFFLVLAGGLLLREKIKAAQLSWLVTAFSGLILVSDVTWSDFSVKIGYLLGLGMAIGAAILYTFASLAIKQLKNIPPHVIAFYQTGQGVILLLPFVSFDQLHIDGSEWAFLIALGVLHTTIMYIFLYAGIQRLPTTMLAPLSFIYPAVAVLVDIFAFDKVLTAGQWLGMALIMLSGAAVNLKWKIPRMGRSLSQRG